VREDLVALYENVGHEIVYLREAEFRLAIAAVTLDAAVAASLGSVPLTHDARFTVSVLTTATVVVLAGYIFRAHAWLMLQRRLRHRLETALGAYEVGRWIPGQALFPAAWQHERRYRFWRHMLGLVFPLATFVLVFHGLFLYLVWTRKA
jgi:hypothetical protein